MSKETTVFGPLELPSGRKVKFREPTGRDRVNVIQMAKMSMENVAGNSLLIDSYVAAKCLVEIDGKEPDPDYKRVYDMMPQADADFYQAVFTELFGMTDEKRASAKEAARFLRQTATSTAGSK